MNKNVASPVADIELKMHQNRIAVGAPAGIPYRGTYGALPGPPIIGKGKRWKGEGWGRKREIREKARRK